MNDVTGLYPIGQSTQRGGMILPMTQLVLGRAAGPERLGRVMGKVGFVGRIAPISGHVLGRVLIDGWGRRWVFFVNVPLILVSPAMTLRWFPQDEERGEPCRAAPAAGRSGRPAPLAGGAGNADGFASALTWMYILTATGLVMAASLPGRK
ncbi:hypothetical protein GCM10022224_030050 [Nonomuraea antimicrobica]|uniref:Major Facilitator Superfamily protein n=1 Tax=Nonomuraea antimicrobica TaxID=561173 RepID=A0ABP7BMX0_9ACTN